MPEIQEAGPPAKWPIPKRQRVTRNLVVASSMVMAHAVPKWWLADIRNDRVSPWGVFKIPLADDGFTLLVTTTTYLDHPSIEPVRVSFPAPGGR
jgi:hypothetical protein